MWETDRKQIHDALLQGIVLAGKRSRVRRKHVGLGLCVPHVSRDLTEEEE